MLKTIVASVLLLAHPVHVSVMSIDYSPEKDSFNAFVRMHLDDFLLDYKLNGGNEQELNIAGEEPESVRLLGKYLNEKVIFFLNDKQVKGTVREVETADGEITISLFYNVSWKPGRITIKNLIMTKLYSDQTNMVILRVNDFEEGIKLTPDKTEQTFLLK